MDSLRVLSLSKRMFDRIEGNNRLTVKSLRLLVQQLKSLMTLLLPLPHLREFELSTS